MPFSSVEFEPKPHEISIVGLSQGKACGRTTAKAESPPTNGNDMKVLHRAVCSWSNGALVLGSAFMTDNRNIDGILMIRNTRPGGLPLLWPERAILSDPSGLGSDGAEAARPSCHGERVGWLFV